MVIQQGKKSRNTAVSLLLRNHLPASQHDVGDQDDDGGYGPAARIGGHQHAEGVGMGEEGVNPEDADAADADQGRERRNQGIAVAAHDVGHDFDKGVDDFSAEDKLQTDDARINDRWVGVKDAEQMAAEKQQQRGRNAGGEQVLEQANPGHFPAAVRKVGTVVLADEGGSGLTEGSDDIVFKNLDVECCRGRCHDGGSKAVDGRLDADVGQGENHSLHAGRNTDAENFFQNFSVDAQITEADMQRARMTAQNVQHQSGTDAVGNNGCCRGTIDIHMKYNDEKQVQSQVDAACHEQAEQRGSGISLASENRGFKVVEQDYRHADQINSEIQECHAIDIIWNTQKPYNRPGEQLADQNHSKAADDRH